MQIIWTKHAEERQQQWQQTRLEITRQAIETVLSYPEQIGKDSGENGNEGKRRRIN